MIFGILGTRLNPTRSASVGRLVTSLELALVVSNENNDSRNAVIYACFE